MEKVKEIKEALELNKYFAIEYFSKSGESKIFTFTDLLTLINDLESENKWLVGKVKEKVTYIVNNRQQLKNRIAELEKELKEEKMCSFNRSTIIMLNEKKLEHLEVENERLANRITCQVVFPDDKLEEIKKECLEKVELAKGELLKHFAERLKDKFYDTEYRAKTKRKTISVEELKAQMDWILHEVVIKNIDETLKEFYGKV